MPLFLDIYFIGVGTVQYGGWWGEDWEHRLNMEVDLQSLFGLHVT